MATRKKDTTETKREAVKKTKSTSSTSPKTKKDTRKTKTDDVNTKKKIVQDVTDEMKSLLDVDPRLISVAMANVLGSRGGEESFVTTISKSIIRSYNTYSEVIKNYVSKVPVSFVSPTPNIASMDSARISKEASLDGKGKYIFGEIKFQKNQFAEKKMDHPDIKGYEFVEYQYNVSSLVQYYTKRFPDIIEMFTVFSDMCILKNKIDVDIEFNDDFIYKFFVKLFKDRVRKQQEKKQKEYEKKLKEESEKLDDTSVDSLFSDFSYSEDSTSTSEPMDTTGSDEGVPGLGLLEQELSSTSFRPVFDSDVHLNDLKVELYDEIYKDVESQLNHLISEVQEIIRDRVGASVIKKMKYAVKIADLYGYSVVTIDKKTHTIHVYDPTQIKLYKPTNPQNNEFIFAVRTKDDEIKILNKTHYCYLFSLDPTVMMPVPNIVKASWYLYLLDLLEILIVMNDILKSKAVNILQIPVFDMDYQTNEEDKNVLDSLSVMNMIINNIESKLVLDSNVMSPGEDNIENTAMNILKNVGMAVSYVPKLSRDSRIENVRLDVPDQKYETLHTMLIDKIMSTFRFPRWMSSSGSSLLSLKQLPREVVQFGNLMFSSRLNSAVGEIKCCVQFYLHSILADVSISYRGYRRSVKPEFDKITVHIENLIDEYLFDREKTENIRQLKISNIITLFTTGTQLNPRWILKHAYPEYDPDEILVNEETNLNALQEEIMAIVSEEFMLEEDASSSVPAESIGNESEGETDASGVLEDFNSSRQFLDWKRIGDVVGRRMKFGFTIDE
jgi:hypothetical protein